MAALADTFNGKLAVYSTAFDMGVSNFYKSNAVLHDAVVTQSIKKFWQCANSGRAVFLVFSGEEESISAIFRAFESGRGSRSKKICKDFNLLG